MATSVAAVVSIARIWAGDVKRRETAPDEELTWDDNSLASLATAAAGAVSSIHEQQYTVSGNTLTDTYSPDPDDNNDVDLVALFLAKTALINEQGRWARRAISHSNAAGSTNMKDVHKAIADQLMRIDDEIDKIEFARRNESIAGDMVARELRSELSSATESHTRAL